MEFVRPKKLNRGDTVGIVAPSMHVDDQSAVDRGIRKLGELGFCVEVGPNLYRKYEDTTAPAEKGAKEIMDMFLNPKIKAIVCLYGGRCADLLDLLDYDLIAKNPKIFSGQSDITHLHLAFLSKARMLSLHGPDLRWGFGDIRNDQNTKYNMDLFMACCTSETPFGIMPVHTAWECWRPGQAEGRLVGGHLATVAKLSQGQYWPDIRGGMLFLESPSCNISRLETNLSMLESSGVFETISGLIIGHVGGSPAETDIANPGVRQLVLEVTGKREFPILSRVDFGHQGLFMPMPEGLLVRLDAEKRTLEYVEAMVEA